MDYEALIWGAATLCIAPLTVYFAIVICFDYIGRFLFERGR